MRHPQIRSRVRRGKRYFYCQINHKQYGLGVSIDEARKAFAKLMGDAHSSDHETIERTESSGITIGQLLALFDEWGRDHRSARTRDDYGYWLTRWIDGSRISDKTQADEIRPHHVDRFIADQRLVGTWAHIKIVRSVRRLFWWAKKQGYLPSTFSNPASACEMPPEPKSPDLDYSNQQLRYLMRSNHREFGAIVRFMIGTGCRAEEVHQLKVSQVDWRNRTITIPWQKAKQGKKTRSDRVIRYPKKLERMVMRRYQKGSAKSGSLFLNTKGHPWTMNAIGCTFKRTHERKPDMFPDGCYATGLRYTFTTRAILNGVGPVELAKLLGHTDLKMLMKHYQKIGRHEDHLQATSDQAVRKRDKT